MLFWACCLRREGKPIPRWQLHAVTRVPAVLTIREERDDWLGRTVRVARLQNDRQHDVYPPLIDAQVIQVDRERMVINGIERDETTRADRAQTWLLHMENPKSS